MNPTIQSSQPYSLIQNHKSPIEQQCQQQQKVQKQQQNSQISLQQQQKQAQQLQNTQKDDQFQSQCLKQYYQYLHLIKRTNNFSKNIQYYSQFNDNDFQQITLIGWVFGIENIKIKYQQNGVIKEQINMVPVLNTNVIYPFKNYQVPINIHNNNSVNQHNKKHHQHQQTNNNNHINNNNNCINNNNNNKSSSSSHYIKRNLICPKNNYMKNFMKTFNQIFKQSKQYKNILFPFQPNILSSSISTSGSLSSSNPLNYPNLQQLGRQQKIKQIYCFTSLLPMYHQDKLYFAFTDKTKIISLQIRFYLEYIENMQKSLAFMYSYLEMPLSTDTNHNKLIPEILQEGYLLTNLQKHASIIDKLSFMAILKDYNIQKKVQGNPSNRKQNQLILTFYQDGLRPNSTQLGLAKVIIKLSPNQSVQQIKKYLQPGYIYLVYNVMISISDTVNITYKLKQKWKNHILYLGVYRNINFINKYLKNNQQSQQNLNSDLNYNGKQFPLTLLRTLKLPNINRNIIKIKVDLVKLEHLFAKIICTKCKNHLKVQKICNNCGQNQGQMILWAVALACDQSLYVQLSIQSRETIQFFQLTLQHMQQMRKRCFQLQQSKSNTLKMYQIFNYFDYFTRRTSSQPLLKYQKHLATKFISKQILCTPRYNVNQSFNTKLTEEEKLYFQQSLQSSKQFMKKNKNKIHFNGHPRKIDKTPERKIVAHVKVIQVGQ